MDKGVKEEVDALQTSLNIHDSGNLFFFASTNYTCRNFLYHSFLYLQSSDVDWELPRSKVRIMQQLGIGEFGPIYDAEVQLEVNVVSRALVKVSLLHGRLTDTTLHRVAI